VSGPVDPRLLHHGRAARGYLVLSIALGATTAILVVVRAWLLAAIVVGAAADGKDLEELRGPLVALLVVVLVRAAIAWYSDVAADRCSARVKSQLRAALAERVAADAPSALGGGRTGELVTLATRGVDALDGYFSRYLPQLVLAVIVPVTVLAVVAVQDWLSALIIAVTLPLIPVFMVLIGMATRSHTDRQLRTLQLLSGHFLDVVAGLPTLKVFGRSKAQVETIRAVTDRYRQATMSTLRLAFLSALVLELLASVAVALVAVSIGLRLLHGEVGFETALLVLILAPEAYLPLRAVGTHFHASAEGLSAAEQLFEILERPVPRRGARLDAPDPSRAPLVLEHLRVDHPGRDRPALEDFGLEVEPGEIVALTGPSGCGKSTLLSVLLGFVSPTAGTVRVGAVDLADVDPDAWRRRVAWVPQRPYLFASSIDANIRLGRPSATAAEVDAAVAAAGLAPVVAGLPAGLGTTLGERGVGLSAGERQRVALARAFLRDAPLLLLDEPTASLDGEVEAEVLAAVRRLSERRTVLLVAHRPALAALADRVVAMDHAGVAV
jgi:thiol reductant ABC exporter CydD subunit